jgi:hypothetical protein
MSSSRRRVSIWKTVGLGLSRAPGKRSGSPPGSPFSGFRCSLQPGKMTSANNGREGMPPASPPRRPRCPATSCFGRHPFCLAWPGRGLALYWGWAGSEGSTMRRRTVVRLAATLMFAGRCTRMSVIRRKLPLTSFASAEPRHSAAGDQTCNGGTPAHRGTLGPPGQPAGGPTDRTHGIRRRSSRPTRTRRAPGR